MDSWGSKRLGSVLKPAERIARDGFTVDATFRSQTESNQARFKNFPDTAKLFLPAARSRGRIEFATNPDLAKTYEELGKKGVGAIYHGDLGEDIVATVNKPPVDPASGYNARPGKLSSKDLAAYRQSDRRRRRRRTVAGRSTRSPPSSSGGTRSARPSTSLRRRTFRRRATSSTCTTTSRPAGSRSRTGGAGWATHLRGRPHEGTPLAEVRRLARLPDQGRRGPDEPARTGRPAPSGGLLHRRHGRAPTTYEGENTTSPVADKWGNVVSYTLTIEQTGGSGITVPGRGFLLNNELTDFSFTPANPAVHDPNLPGPGKRPRSSISPTIVLDRHNQPVVALGSPRAGATIITTVLQTLTEFLDRGLPLVDAIAAPRASQRNAAQTELEPGLYDSALRTRLEALGHSSSSTPRSAPRRASNASPTAGGWRPPRRYGAVAARRWWCDRRRSERRPRARRRRCACGDQRAVRMRGPVRVMATVCSRVGRAGAVVGAQRPAVGRRVEAVGAAADEHGLDREHHAVAEGEAAARAALVRDGRVLVCMRRPTP